MTRDELAQWLLDESHRNSDPDFTNERVQSFIEEAEETIAVRFGKYPEPRLVGGTSENRYSINQPLLYKYAAMKSLNRYIKNWEESQRFHDLFVGHANQMNIKYLGDDWPTKGARVVMSEKEQAVAAELINDS